MAGAAHPGTELRLYYFRSCMRYSSRMCTLSLVRKIHGNQTHSIIHTHVVERRETRQPPRCRHRNQDVSQGLTGYSSSKMMSCPDSWIALAGGCYRISTQPATHWACVDTCGPGASLACISSAAENAALANWTRGIPGLPFLWIGNYQRPTDAEPAGGWDVCSSGEMTTYANWNGHDHNGLGQQPDNICNWNANKMAADCAVFMWPVRVRLRLSGPFASQDRRFSFPLQNKYRTHSPNRRSDIAHDFKGMQE